MTMEKILPCKLENAEIQSYALDVAGLCSSLRTVESEKKTVDAKFNDQIKKLKNEIDCLVESIKNGSEDRPVSCDFKINKDRRTMETIRIDIGEVCEERPLNPDEMNQDLFND